MLTRTGVAHAYTPYPVRRRNIPGAIKQQDMKGITQTWAIARPNSAPQPTGAPFYMVGYDTRHGELIRTGQLALTPATPNVAMDPSDMTTWQRTYKFT